MADTAILVNATPGSTLYAQVRNGTGQVWNGAAFENYNAGNWNDYDIALTEQGSCGIFVGTFPAGIADGSYTVAVFQQAGGSPAAGDLCLGLQGAPWEDGEFSSAIGVGPAIIGACATATGFSTHDAAAVATAILATPANKLATDGDGYVTAENMRGTDDANTTEPPSAASIATAVWGAGTRTLTSAANITAGIAQAVWEYTTRLLSAFAFNTSNSTLEARLTTERAALLDHLDADVSSRSDFDASEDTVAVANTADCKADVSALANIQAVTDTLADTVEDDGEGTYRFTAGALAEAPAPSDATIAKQDAILAVLTALNNVSAGAVATAVLETAVDGTVTLAQAAAFARAFAAAKVVVASTDPLVLNYRNAADTATLFAITLPSAGGRTVS